MLIFRAETGPGYSTSLTFLFVFSRIGKSVQLWNGGRKIKAETINFNNLSTQHEFQQNFQRNHNRYLFYMEMSLLYRIAGTKDPRHVYWQLERGNVFYHVCETKINSPPNSERDAHSI